MKQTLIELANLLGLQNWEYRDYKTECENLMSFLIALCRFLGGNCNG